MADRRDAVVVGAGFGGLAAALTLAEAGARVTLCEAVTYPGGCASTFTRGGRRYEAGATLFSGFAPGQLMNGWIRRHALPVRVVVPDPVIRLRAPGLALDVPPSRERLIEQLCALPGAPREALRAFFAEQAAVADALWALLDDPALLPPFGASSALRHATWVPRYLPLARVVGRPLGAVVARHGLSGFAPLRVYLDAVCQITVQCSAAEAEAPFALGAMDYCFRGTGHVVGGVGELADALVQAIIDQGGEVRFADRVRGLEDADGRWTVRSRRGDLEAEAVVANLLPQDLRALLGWAPGRSDFLDQLAARVEEGWGAAMLYRTARADALPWAPPFHLELVADPAQPFVEGNHVFLSAGDPADDGLCPLTISTHLPQDGPPEAQQALVEAAQARMRRTLAELAPEVEAATVHEMTASPRTFARFTRRHRGFVGGVPRRAGLRAYTNLGPQAVAPGLHLVGDSVFPGQSTLGVALGGLKVAEVLLDGRLRRRAARGA